MTLAPLTVTVVVTAPLGPVTLIALLPTVTDSENTRVMRVSTLALVAPFAGDIHISVSGVTLALPPLLLPPPPLLLPPPHPARRPVDAVPRIANEPATTWRR